MVLEFAWPRIPVLGVPSSAEIASNCPVHGWMQHSWCPSGRKTAQSFATRVGG